MSYENIKVEIEGYLATITVHRPEKLNALDNETISELIAAVETVSNDASVGAVIVTGAGEKAFVAGADIGMLADQGPINGRINSGHGQRLTQLIETSPKPFLAAINGYALGGGLELALACDMRYASDKARVGLPEVSLGIIPGYGGTVRLPRIVGMGRALEMILTGDPIVADEALRIGLVNAVFPAAELMEQVGAIASKIISRGPMAVALAKQSARRAADLSIDDGLALEADLFGIISSTDEMKEGTRAFLEKRAPGWKR